MKYISNLLEWKKERRATYFKFCLVALLSVTISFLITSNIVNAEIKKGVDNKYQYYTNKTTQVDIPLAENTDPYFVSFVKEEPDKFIYQKSMAIPQQAKQVTFMPPILREGVENVFYVGTTNLKEADLQQFNNSTGQVENGVVRLVNKTGETLVLRKISVWVDKQGPTISIPVDDMNKYISWTNKERKIKFTVSDDGIGVDDNTLTCMLGKDVLPIENGVNTGEYYVDIDTPEQTVLTGDVKITATDRIANQSSITVPIKIDKISPQIELVNMKYEDKWVKSWEFEIKVTDEGSGLQSVTGTLQDNQKGTVAIQQKNGTTNSYIAKVTAMNDCIYKGKIKITATDKAGNTSDKETEEIRLDGEKPQVSKANIFVLPSRTNKVAKLGDTIEVCFSIIDAESGVKGDSIEVNVNGVKANQVNHVGNDYTYKLDLTSDKFTKDNVDLIISIKCSDNAGNLESFEKNTNIPLFFPLTKEGVISKEIIYKTNNKKSTKYATVENTITLSFTSTHHVTPKASITQNEDKPVEWEESKIENGIHTYTGTYVVIHDNDKKKDGKEIPYKLKITDAVDETGVDFKNQDNQVIYCAPIEDCVRDFFIQTSNKVSPNKYAKEGDEFKITFKTSKAHKISMSDKIKLAKQDVKFTIKSDEKEDVWVASCKIKSDLDDNKPIPYSFELTDDYGNTPLKLNESNKITEEKNIIYLGPIQLSEVNMTSNNLKLPGKVAKEGDQVTISFTSNHPIELKNARVGNSKVTFSSSKGEKMKWNGVYTVATGDTQDVDIIRPQFSAEDLAGNTPKTERECDFPKIIYYAPITVPQTSAISTNTRDSKRYVKNDETVTIDFTANHEVSITNASIIGNANILTNKITAKTNSFSYIIRNGDIKDQADVDFSFTITDIAGNGPVTKTNATVGTNTLKYYAPIQAETEFYSNNCNNKFAKNGSVASVELKANHAVNVNDCTISGRQTIVKMNNSDTVVMNYEIPTNEFTLQEGLLSFVYFIDDAAGNEFTANQATNAQRNEITYDRTRPTITTTSPFSGFTNNSFKYTVTFTDANLNPAEVSLRLNGAELILDSERASITSETKTFSKTIYLNNENQYKIATFAEDLASNPVMNESKSDIIIDKTNPEVQSYKVQLDEAKTFKRGFVLSDYFQIQEQYVREIICVVTDKNGSLDWNIDDAIIADGKKSAYITATDMSNNASVGVTYDFYIDGTQPQLIVKEAKTNTIMESATKSSFVSDMVLKIKLNNLHVGSEEPDQFTKLKLIDDKGNLVRDILKDDRIDKDTYTLPVTSLGSYTLVATAIDGVGNEMKEVVIPFELKDKSWFVKFYENKLFFYGSITTFLLMITGIIIMVVRAKKRRAAELLEELSEY